jgi:hypothetical protein
MLAQTVSTFVHSAASASAEGPAEDPADSPVDSFAIPREASISAFLVGRLMITKPGSNPIPEEPSPWW